MTTSLFNIENKIIVITGGFGQLGLKFAEFLVDKKARVVIVDICQDNKKLAESLKEAEKENHLLLLKADITQEDELKNTLIKIQSHWGTPAGLINNAALDSPPHAAAQNNGPFENYPTELFEAVMKVNVTGTLLACKIFGSAMAQEKSGSIINISSIYGMLSPDQTIYQYRRDQGDEFYKPISYSVSKSALFNLTRYLATYWAKAGVRVNTLTLGGVFNHQDETFLKNYCAKVPLGRLSKA